GSTSGWCGRRDWPAQIGGRRLLRPVGLRGAVAPPKRSADPAPGRDRRAAGGRAAPLTRRGWRDGADTYLPIRNPYARYLKYRAGVVLPDEVRPRDTKTCAALTDYRPTLQPR